MVENTQVLDWGVELPSLLASQVRSCNTLCICPFLHVFHLMHAFGFLLCTHSSFVHLYFFCGRHSSLTPFVKRSESEQDLLRRGESVVEHWEGEGILVKKRKKSIFPLTMVPLKSDHIIKTRKLQQDQKLPGRTSRRGENKSSRSQVLRSQKREGLTRTLMYLTSRLRMRKTDQRTNPGV